MITYPTCQLLLDSNDTVLPIQVNVGLSGYRNAGTIFGDYVSKGGTYFYARCKFPRCR